MVRSPIRDFSTKYVEISDRATPVLNVLDSCVASGNHLPDLRRVVPHSDTEPILRLSLACTCRLLQHNVRATSLVSLCLAETWLSSTALYGLIVFYGLTKDELKDKRPLAKFLAIKLIVVLTFYQSFLVSYESGCDGIRPQIFHSLPCWKDTSSMVCPVQPPPHATH